MEFERFDTKSPSEAIDVLFSQAVPGLPIISPEDIRRICRDDLNYDVDDGRRHVAGAADDMKRIVGWNLDNIPGRLDAGQRVLGFQVMVQLRSQFAGLTIIVGEATGTPGYAFGARVWRSTDGLFVQGWEGFLTSPPASPAPPQTDRDELLRLLSDEKVDPAKVLPRIGGAAALDALIDLLVREPVPLEKTVFYENVVTLLGEIGDPRAVDPMMSKYRQYRVLEGVTAGTLRADYGSIDDLRTTVSAHQGSPESRRAGDLMFRVMGFWLFRYHLLDALLKLRELDARTVMGTVLELEHNASVRRKAAFVLARLGDPRAIEELGQFLTEQTTAGEKESSPAAVKEAIDLLHPMADPRGREVVVDFHARCTDRSKLDLRNHAAAKLGLPVTVPETKSRCFIATAACGSPEAPEVTALQQFRDRCLARRRLGRIIVHTYECVSAPLADFIRSRPLCRAAVRLLVVRPAIFFVGPIERNDDLRITHRKGRWSGSQTHRCSRRRCAGRREEPMFAEDPKCPKCGTVYNRGPVIREIKKLSPWLFESAVWTTRFKCLKCREEITISGVRGE